MRLSTIAQLIDTTLTFASGGGGAFDARLAEAFGGFRLFLGLSAAAKLIDMLEVPS